MSEQGRKYDSVLSAQHGGKHYKEKGIQPIEYANANDLSFFQGNVVKYVTRYKDKKGVEDVKKAIHYLQMILEFEYNVFTDFAYSDEADISQEELKSYVNSVVESDKERLWCPPVEDGGNPWIEYDGSGQPVEDSVLVETLFSDERIGRKYVDCIAPAGDYLWEDSCLVAYRVV